MRKNPLKYHSAFQDKIILIGEKPDARMATKLLKKYD